MAGSGTLLIGLVVLSHMLLVVESVGAGSTGPSVISLILTALTGAVPLTVAMLAYRAGRKGSIVAITACVVWALLLALDAHVLVVTAALVAAATTLIAVWLPSSRRYVELLRADRHE